MNLGFKLGFRVRVFWLGSSLSFQVQGIRFVNENFAESSRFRVWDFSVPLTTGVHMQNRCAGRKERGKKTDRQTDGDATTNATSVRFVCSLFFIETLYCCVICR
jgi:hypothetical protein